MNRGIVQQVGTPTEIYDRPANTFVASFIGSPAMNLITGVLERGVFTGDHVRIPGLSGSDGPATVGFRAEDATVVEGQGEITAPAYTVELLGDATMITLRLGGTLVSVKAKKDFRAEIGDTVAISVPPGICHLFDVDTGNRIAAH
jgi:multiple sugar transport system ATP-binding protein